MVFKLLGLFLYKICVITGPFVLQDLLKTLEADSFEKIKSYIDTVARTELLTCSAVQISFNNIKNTASCISRGHNYRCYLKAYPSLAEHVT